MMPTALDGTPIAELIPHAGNMVLLDRLLHWDDRTLLAETNSHRQPAHPLARDGMLDSIHLVEYGAQAMAIHGGLLERAEGRAPSGGMIAGLRQLQLACARIDTVDGALQVQVERLFGNSSGWMYQFAVHEANGACLASGRIAVMLGEAPAATETN